MQLKYSSWLSLALAMVFSSASAFALAAPQNGVPPPPPGSQPNPMRGVHAQQQQLPPLPPTLEMETAEQDAQRTIPGAYRLTYTLTEMDGAKRVGSHHYVIAVDVDAPPTSLKLGTKIPIETGASGPGSLPGQTEISYIDIGVNIRSHLRQFANGVELNSHVVQSAVDPLQSALKTPVIRVSEMESTVLLNENKPVILGNVDTPGSTHSLQIQVEMTSLR